MAKAKKTVTQPAATPVTQTPATQTPLPAIISEEDRRQNLLTMVGVAFDNPIIKEVEKYAILAALYEVWSMPVPTIEELAKIIKPQS